MRKTLVLAASIVLAGYASAAVATPRAMPRNIAVVAMTVPAPATGRVCPVFFTPGSAALTPTARAVVASAARVAAKGRKVTLVVAETAGLMPVATAAPLWRARIAAVKAAIAHSPAGRPSA